MSLIAGIVWHGDSRATRENLESALARSLSRHPGETISRYEFKDALFLKADVGAFQEPGVHVDSGATVTLIAGNPIVPNANGGVVGRQDACELLGNEILAGSSEVLRSARGVFSGAHYDSRTRSLALFGDRLGVRPMYYTVNSNFTAFSTALRVLEGLPAPGREMDLTAVTQVVVLGYPLGTRTAYADIRAIDAAEIVRFNGPVKTHQHYWRWNEVAEASPTALEGLGDALFDAFMEGVKLRVGSDKTTAAFLSGGLDSRCIVAALADLNVNVNTFMFASEIGEEEYCATEFAGAMGVKHRIVTDPTFPPQWGMMIARAWKAAGYGEPLVAERPQLVWSGDGGSVGLGWVYLSPDMIACLRRGDRSGALDLYLERYGSAIPEQLVRTPVATALASVRRDINAELDRLHCSDPARSFYFFLLLNDQRRHLAAYYEDIDLHRMEYQLPFFDWQFMTLATSIPADLGLGHKFYTDWLAKFPAAVTSVPWQTYPGHVPSRHPIPAGLANQWDPQVHTARSQRLRSQFTREANEALRAKPFPSPLVRRGTLAMLAAVHGLRLRNYDYAIHAAVTYARYWRFAHGKYTNDAALHDE